MTPIHPDVLKDLDRKRPWIIMPVLAHRDYTIAAIADCLAQTCAHRLLVVNQGVDNAFREELERVAEAADDRILLWSHVPPLLSLSATWNRALDAAWEAGAEDALVINNDVRLRPWTLQLLQTTQQLTHALFVSAVGVTPADYEKATEWTPHPSEGFLKARGGPDFSCYLITRECHRRYRFDERFIPAFCEDLDYHRRLMLGGDGAKIFSVSVPYLHYASATLKSLPDDQANRLRREIEAQSRTYYALKWGGPVNQERFAVPFAQDGMSGWNTDKVTTPVLQRRVAQGLPPVGCEMHDDQPIECPVCEKLAEEYDQQQLEEVEESLRRSLREGVGESGTFAPPPAPSWTAADRERALQQPEDLDE